MRNKTECNKYIGIVWPSAYKFNTDKSIEKIINSYGKVLDVKIIQLSSFIALKNTIYQIYIKEPWIGTLSNCFRGVNGKAGFCFDEELLLTIIEFYAESVSVVNEIKDKIRILCGMEKHSFHTTDNIEEYENTCKILFNNNSLFFINNTVLYQNPLFQNAFNDYFSFVLGSRMFEEDYAVILPYNEIVQPKLSYIQKCENPSMTFLFDDAQYYGWYLGVKFLSATGTYAYIKGKDDYEHR